MKFIVLITVISASVCAGSQLRADINGDGIVNFGDFSILASEWLCEDDMNKVVQFDGSGVITVPNNAAFIPGSGDFSISVSFKTGTSNSSLTICEATNEAPDNIMSVMLGGTYPSRRIRFSLTQANTTVFVYSDYFDATAWHHAVGVFDRDGLLTVYLDGVVSGTPTDISGAAGDLALTSLLYFGRARFSATPKYDGLLDDFRIYKSALSPAQVSAIYNDGHGCKYHASQAGTAAFVMEFDEGTGNPLSTLPSGAGQLTGTIAGGVAWIDGGVPFIRSLCVGNTTSEPLIAGIISGEPAIGGDITLLLPLGHGIAENVCIGN